MSFPDIKNNGNLVWWHGPFSSRLELAARCCLAPVRSFSEFYNRINLQLATRSCKDQF